MKIGRGGGGGGDRERRRWRWGEEEIESGRTEEVRNGEWWRLAVERL